MSDPPLSQLDARPREPAPADPPLSRRERLKPGLKRSGRRARMWMAPGIGVKRWITLFVACTLLGAVGVLHFTWTGPLHFVATRWILWVNALVSP